MMRRYIGGAMVTTYEPGDRVMHGRKADRWYGTVAATGTNGRGWIGVDWDHTGVDPSARIIWCDDLRPSDTADPRRQDRAVR